MALGSSINRAAAVAQLYQMTTRQHPDEVLKERVRRYEKFKKLPVRRRILQHLTLRAPWFHDYRDAKHELAVRRGEAQPYWHVKEYIIDRETDEKS